MERMILIVANTYIDELLNAPESEDEKFFDNENNRYRQHEQLRQIINEQLIENREVLIIDCHSFNGDSNEQNLEETPDFYICADDNYTPRGLYKYALVLLRLRGYNAKLSLSDSNSDAAKYPKERGVNLITVKINRDLFFIPGTYKKREDYHKSKSFLQEFIKKLGQFEFKTDIPNLIKTRYE